MSSSTNEEKPVENPVSPDQKPSENIPVEETPTWWAKLPRHLGDILGILFVSLALITLLGLLNLAKGDLLSGWVNALRLYFGWGSFLVAAFFGLFGLLAIRIKALMKFTLPLGRILLLEFWAFLLLIFFSLNGGHDIHRAEEGLDGGLLGWGLTEIYTKILPGALGNGILVILLIIFALFGFGILEIFIKRLNFWAENVQQERDIDIPEQMDLLLDQPTAPQIEAESKENEKPVEQEPIQQKRKANLPSLDLLRLEQSSEHDETMVHDTAKKIEQTLDEFGVPARVVGFRVGPTVTQYAVEPGFIERKGVDGEVTLHKVRVSQISRLSKDLSLALSAQRLRIEAPVPGQSFVGIEVPNSSASLVGLRSMLESDSFSQVKSQLAIALGKNVSGQPIVADLTKMPHLLIAGTTGSGKSVCIAALTVCLVMNNSPEDLKLAMLDPKMVELVRFNGLPHLMGKVETDIERMLGALQWVLQEMDRRYRKLEETGARDIDSYNRKMARQNKEKLPKLVVFIDELADLMMSAPEQTEHTLVRLAQMARATGIHLIVATQRPSTDVVTGLIKANFPSRLSFSVASSIDSRVILDETGAETLLGRGDMLFLNPEIGSPVRAQGIFVTDEEIERIVHFWQHAVEDEEKEAAPWEDMIQNLDESGPDRLVSEAMEIVKKSQRASASYLQRRLRIGYPRAARLIDELEELGVVGPSLGGGREREVLIAEEEHLDANSEEEIIEEINLVDPDDVVDDEI